MDYRNVDSTTEKTTLIIYHSGGGDKDWQTVFKPSRERVGMKIHYSGGAHEHPRIPALLKGTAIMLTFIDNIHRPEKVLRRIYRFRRRG